MTCNTSRTAKCGVMHMTVQSETVFVCPVLETMFGRYNWHGFDILTKGVSDLVANQ